ncbi:MAG: hypothetical protein A2Y41_07640 [Spirochaetes bacterium GWB1_36_13]|nr:MAG: hypothetical protein A2Y41_07640 [Spirochaetes bacterium GWB1_36_13]
MQGSVFKEFSERTQSFLQVKTEVFFKINQLQEVFMKKFLGILGIILFIFGCGSNIKPEDHEALKNKNGELEKALAEKQKESETLQEEINQLKLQMQKISDEKTALENELKSEKETYSANMAEMQGKMEENEKLYSQNALKNPNISKNQEEIDKKNKEVESLKKDMNQLKDSLSKSLNEQKKLLADEIAKLKSQLKENEAKTQEALNKSKSVESQAEAIKKQIQEKEAMMNELNQKIAKLAEEGEKKLKEKDEEISKINQVYTQLVDELKQEIDKKEITITKLKDKLTIQVLNQVVFASGKASVTKEGEKVLQSVAKILQDVKDKQIFVEGHTDDLPIVSSIASQFPTNWELSAARAISVVRFFQNQGIDPKLLAAVGYGEFKPIVPNDTMENRKLNRRVEIVLLPMINKTEESTSEERSDTKKNEPIEKEKIEKLIENQKLEKSN